MMPLNYLHSQLDALKQRRQWFRWSTAASAIAIAALLALAGVFALDWFFERTQDLWQRIFVLALAIAGAVWAIRRFALPWFQGQEDTIDLALLVQKHAGIDSDLVAALQFGSAQSPQWGSTQLQGAVIESMEVRQKNIDVLSVVPREPLLTRLKWLAGIVLVWLILTVLYPAHVGVFLQRLFLSSKHYPTRTQVVALKVNGKNVELNLANPTVRVAYGRPVNFELHATPNATLGGRIKLSAQGLGTVADIALEPFVKSGSEETEVATLQGKHDRLLQSTRCQIFVGDAFTDPLTIDVVPAPIIEIAPEVIPPAYAREEANEVLAYRRGISQFAVLEGSEVRLKVYSDRSLKSMSITVGEPTSPIEMEKIESNPDGEIWSLKKEGNPLASVMQATRFAIQVVDADDDSLDRPLQGLIRIEPDLPPRVAAATKTKVILPDAQPTIYFGATDDYAVNRVWLSLEVVRSGETMSEAAMVQGVYQLGKDESPSGTQEGAHTLDLGSLKMDRGDTLKVTVKADDYRGAIPGKSTSSETLVFQVTDEQGVLSSLLDGDQKSARQLEGVIKNLLGIGGSP